MMLCAFWFLILQNKHLYLSFAVYQNAYIVKLMYISIKDVVHVIYTNLDNICLATVVLNHVDCLGNRLLRLTLRKSNVMDFV